MSSPKKQVVRWGILGTARIAEKITRAIKLADGAELIAIASRNEQRARQWAKEHGLDRAYGSYRALIEDPEIDAVYIPLPPSMHMEWTIKAAEQGKHVLCEKPLASNADEGQAMVTACKNRNVQLMDGVIWVHHERTQMMKKILDEGSLGLLRRVTAAFSFHWDEVPNDNIRLKKELAGGCLGDLGYYCVRAILWALGDLPTGVYATARYRNAVDFNLSGMLWFQGERIGSFDCGFDTVMRKWFEIAGTQGSLVCEDFVIPWDERTARFWVHRGSKDVDHKVKGCIQEVRMIEQFVHHVRTGELDDRWPNEALQTMRVCDSLRESATKTKQSGDTTTFAF